MTYSRFGNINNNNNSFGYQRNSRFASITIIPLKTTNTGEETKNKILKSQQAEARRATILALASA